MKSQLTGKDPDTGKDRRQEEKGTTEDEMVGWHHQLNGHEFEETLGGGERQGSLACCSPWGRKESDMTDQLNNNLTRETEDKGAGPGARDPFQACVCVHTHTRVHMSEEVGDLHCPDRTFPRILDVGLCAYLQMRLNTGNRIHIFCQGHMAACPRRWVGRSDLDFCSKAQPDLSSSIKGV